MFLLCSTHGGHPRNLSYVIVRLACTLCSRKGSYRLARLADKYGANADMGDLLEYLAGDCKYWRPRHPIHDGCGAHFCDLGGGQPPDVPGGNRLRLVKR